MNKTEVEIGGYEFDFEAPVQIEDSYRFADGEPWCNNLWRAGILTPRQHTQLSTLFTHHMDEVLSFLAANKGGVAVAMGEDGHLGLRGEYRLVAPNRALFWHNDGGSQVTALLNDQGIPKDKLKEGQVPGGVLRGPTRAIHIKDRVRIPDLKQGDPLECQRRWQDFETIQHDWRESPWSFFLIGNEMGVHRGMPVEESIVDPHLLHTLKLWYVKTS